MEMTEDWKRSYALDEAGSYKTEVRLLGFIVSNASMYYTSSKMVCVVVCSLYMSF